MEKTFGIPLLNLTTINYFTYIITRPKVTFNNIKTIFTCPFIKMCLTKINRKNIWHSAQNGTALKKCIE